MPENQSLLFDDDEELYEGPPADPLSPEVPEFRLFEDFAAAVLRKRAAEREVKQANAEINRLSPYLINFFAANPQFRRPEVCGLVIFQRNQIWAKPKQGYDTQDVCDALQASGLGYFVKDAYNTSRLSSYVRDLEDKNEDRIVDGIVNDVSELLPEPLAKVLNVEPTIKIIGQRTRKSKR